MSAPLHLDFLQAQRPASRWGWLLGLAGVAALGAVLSWHWLELEPEVTNRAAEIGRLQTRLRSSESAGPRMGEQQLAQEWTPAAAVAQQLSAPWDELFALLEKGADQQVALLSLDPDLAKREILLTGEARHYAALMAYYRYLQEQPQLSNVVVHSHQVNRQDRDRPVRFRVSAHWEQIP
jgi:Tfp pilus assembly protein PilN